jgi:hypothetical protein
MAAESGADVHHGAPRCLPGLFEAAATGLADWTEFDAEAERLSIEVRGLRADRGHYLRDPYHRASQVASGS